MRNLSPWSMPDYAVLPSCSVCGSRWQAIHHAHQSGSPANSEADLLGLLIPLDPLHATWSWVVTMENDQRIIDLHICGICHLHRYADPAIGLIKNCSPLPFTLDDHPYFGRV